MVGHLYIPIGFFSSLKLSPEAEYISGLLFVLAFVFIISLTIMMIRGRKLYNPSPEVIRTHIQELCNAIKYKQLQKAYILYSKLTSVFVDQNYWAYHPNSSARADNDIFWAKGFDAAGVHWDRLTVRFLDMLNNYKKFNSNKRNMSVEQIDEMINSLKN